jgi:hypothetical protein
MNVYIYHVRIHGSLSSFKKVPVIAESGEQADVLVREKHPVEFIQFIDKYEDVVQKEVEPVIKDRDFSKKSATILEVEDEHGCAIKVNLISDKHLNGSDIKDYIKNNHPGTESYHIMARANIIEVL